MSRRIPALLIAACFSFSASVRAADDYPLGPDSKPQEGVPKGEVLQFTFDQSKIFPGTTRKYSIYVPKQYDPTKPACLFVDQDGVQFNAPVVFDNLISKGEMPVTIGVFITPGVLKAPSSQALDRFNRSYEYDGLGDAYVRFLLNELLPEAEKKTASDGRPIHFSKNAADRAIAGSSSGAICAFTAAWERPNAFQRVFSSIGTYVDLRGGNVYPSLIRKYEPKPLRVFLQDGSADQNIYGGDWWMANQEMERALVFAGYEVNHAWGDGGHNGKQASAVFPDAMRWLWKGWPEPVKAGASKNSTLSQLLIPGEDWQLVAEGYKGTEGPTANADGEVFFNDVPNSKTYKIGLDGKVTEFIADSKRGDGEAFGPNGSLYAVAGGVEKIFAYSPGKSEPTEIASGFRGNDLVVRHDGLIYVTEPGWDGTKPSNVWLIKANGEKQIVDTGLKFANGITLSPDQSLLYVDDTKSHWIYSYQIQADGTLANKQRYYWLHVPDTADDSGADGMRVDRNGNLYVATRLGVQICDQAGRPNAIIPTPNGKVANLTFGGKNFDTLYAACGDKIYRRKINARAANAWEAPIKPPAPHL
ncbi:MAG TPA: SMP-30/gluconolactonase/LRE family protein [Chthoniobacteraceae bacterium]|jgi:sugar lactone lactonase YvrE/enterochelin esterase-like enzyme